MNKRVSEIELDRYIESMDKDRSDTPEMSEFFNLCLDLRDCREEIYKLQAEIEEWKKDIRDFEEKYEGGDLP